MRSRLRYFRWHFTCFVYFRTLNLYVHWYLRELKTETLFTISIHWREDHCLSEWLQLALEKYLSSAHWQIPGLHSGASCLRPLQSTRLCRRLTQRLTNRCTTLQCLSYDTGLLQCYIKCWGVWMLCRKARSLNEVSHAPFSKFTGWPVIKLDKWTNDWKKKKHVETLTALSIERTPWNNGIAYTVFC